MLIVEQVSKSFLNEVPGKVNRAPVRAVDQLSFQVDAGEIFGLLGPNGAGKTTTMRMILDLMRPDSGSISWQGQTVQKLARRSFGYLPEERGLYPRLVVEDQLLYLARLFGTPLTEVRQHLDYWLARLEIEQHRKKKLEELSKGNQQKIQFLAAILHNPQVLIMDEPFSGLDPLNTVQLKEAFLELHRQGKTILFSTHQMETVEELCENIVLINQGRAVLQGKVARIKQAAGRKTVRLATGSDNRPLEWLQNLPGVELIQQRADYLELNLHAPATAEDLLRHLLERGHQLSRFELTEPSLNDLFIETVSGQLKQTGPVGQPPVAVVGR